MDKEILAALTERYAGRARTMESLQEMLARLGHPERAYACVHIAGTNGKGSVAAMMERVLRESGLSTGRFTSPSLIRIYERITFGGEPIGDALMEDCAREALSAEKALGLGLTAFDRLTLTALLAFARRNVALAVMECGMGGRLDSTNIILPALCILTSIDMDHMRFLGTNIRDIAKEKCGVIKPNIPVVTAPQQAEAMAVIREACEAADAPLFCSGDTVVDVLCSDITGQTLRLDGMEVRLPLAGAHQAQNAALAYTAIKQLPGVFKPDMHAIRAGLERVSWPGRLEWLPAGAGRGNLLLDGAHNAQGARVLSEAVRSLLPGCDPVLLCAVSADKDITAMAGSFAAFARRAVATAVDGRMLPPAALAGHLQDAGVETHAAAGVKEALSLALRLSGGGLVVVAGSLYLVGAVKQYLQDPTTG